MAGDSSEPTPELAERNLLLASYQNNVAQSSQGK